MNQTPKLRSPSPFMRTVYILMRNLSMLSYLLKIKRLLQIVSLLFLKIFTYFTDIRRQLLFNIISFLLDPWSPAIFKFLDATVKK
jgi:Na+-transporting NADH:ubiquinone oxidoreductase subunit NqrE